MLSRKGLVCFVWLLVCARPASAQAPRIEGPPGTGPLDVGTSELRPFLERYRADRGSLLRCLPEVATVERTRRLDEFLGAWRTAAAAIPLAGLSTDGQLELLLFEHHLDGEVATLRLDQARIVEVLPLLPFFEVVVGLDEARRRMEAPDPRAAADLLAQIPRQLRESRTFHERRIAAGAGQGGPAEPGPSRAVALRAARTADQLRSLLHTWYAFREGYDPTFTWWAKGPVAEAEAAIEAHAAFLRERLAGVRPDDPRSFAGDPLGRAALEAALARELVPYSPEELLDLAEAELAWCEAEMTKAAAELGFGTDRRRALEHVKSLHVEPGRQPETVRDLAREAIAWIEAKELVTVPPLAKTSWRMEMMSPTAQLQNPFFLGGESIIVAFPTDGMAHADKLMSLRGNNLPFARATVHHELVPGHHLQGFMTDRYKPYRELFSTPFWIEGWALHFEMLLYELGFPTTPEQRVGMLFWRSHRCARILFSLGFHLERLSPEACVELLVQRVGHERANAEAEVRRSLAGSYGPLYQAAYLLGGLQLRALRSELVLGGGRSDREFHDAVLREGPIPIAFLRARLLGAPLERGPRPPWRFYGDPPKRR